MYPDHQDLQWQPSILVLDLGTNDTRIVTLKKAGQVALGNQVGGSSYIFSIPDDFVATSGANNIATFDNLNDLRRNIS